MNLLLRRRELMWQTPKTELTNVADISTMQTPYSRMSKITDTDNSLYLQGNYTPSAAAFQGNSILPVNTANTKHYISFYLNGTVRISITDSQHGGLPAPQTLTTSTLQRVSIVLTRIAHLSNQSCNGLMFDLSVQGIIKKPMIINLSAIYGIGNEPTKSEMDAIVEAHGGYWSGTIKV